MDSQQTKPDTLSFGQLYLFGLFPYWTMVGMIYLGLVLCSGRGHHLYDWPIAITFLILGICLILLLNIDLAGCARLIIKWAGGFNIKAKIALLLLGTYWYNIVLIPCSIFLSIADGTSPDGLAIFIIGPIIFLVPSLAFLLACHLLSSKNNQISTNTHHE